MTRREVIARKLHGEIGANVDAYYAGAVDHATFDVAARGIWDRVATFGLRDAVLALLRGDAADFDRLVQP